MDPDFEALIAGALGNLIEWAQSAKKSFEDNPEQACGALYRTVSDLRDEVFGLHLDLSDGEKEWI